MYILVLKPWTFPLSSTSAKSAKRDQRKRKTVGGRLVGGSLISKRTYTQDLPWAKMSRSPRLLVRILKVYIEALMGLSHIHNPHGLNTLLSQGCVLEKGLYHGNSVWMYILRTQGGGEEPLIALVQLTGKPAASHTLLMSLSTSISDYHLISHLSHCIP